MISHLKESNTNVAGLSPAIQEDHFVDLSAFASLSY